MPDTNIPKDRYLEFDAMSLKRHIRDQLTASGVFTDQNFEGSHLSTISNILSYTFNGLMYYLNRTSSESMFTEAQLYENMNRIVKMLSYKPIGHQTATLPFELSVRTLSPDTYLIPRYSYFIRNGISYSFTQDVVIDKSLEGPQAFQELSNRNLLYQGRFREHSLQTATGENNEVIFITAPDSVIIDHFNIHVYVKDSLTDAWTTWEQTESLYLEPPQARKYELRLNENNNYEVIFGNDINGSKLRAGDSIAIYYLQGDGLQGEVGQGFLNSASFVRFSSNRFSQIFADVYPDSPTLLPIETLSLTNTFPSSKSREEEDVESIRKNAPGIYRSQMRLVTKDDYSNYVLTNFSNFVQDCSVANNWEFMKDRMQYLYGLGLSNPLKDTPTLYAHSNFADSCNFNNVYLTVVPRTPISTIESAPVLSNSQKQALLGSLQNKKMLTTEPIILNPVYMEVDIGVAEYNSSLRVANINDTILEIVRDPTSRSSDSAIKQKVRDVLVKEFELDNQLLGNTISITNIVSKIRNISGVRDIFTYNTSSGDRAEGLHLIIYNPVYPQDISSITANTTLRPFQFAFMRPQTLLNRIEIVNNSSLYENIEY